MRPYDAKKLGEVCNLRTDSKDVGDYWIMTDGYQVTMHEQKLGKPTTQDIAIPRTVFNRLIDWYMRDQESPSRKARAAIAKARSG